MDRLLYYRKMHSCLRQIGIESAKTHLLEGYGVEHTSELSDADLEHLTNRLVRLLQTKHLVATEEIRRWRSNVLTLCNQYGAYKTNNDWTAINRLLLDKRVSGKLLYEMDLAELKECCVRIHAILNKKAKSDEEERQIAFQN